MTDRAHLTVRPQARAAERFAAMDEPTRASLAKTVVAGLPGRMVEAHNLHQFQARASLLRSRRRLRDLQA